VQVYRWCYICMFQSRACSDTAWRHVNLNQMVSCLSRRHLRYLYNRVWRLCHGPGLSVGTISFYATCVAFLPIEECPIQYARIFMSV
jgi:hypothetical protein